MATEKQVKQAIKQVLDSEYMNKMVTFDKGWKFKVKSYNIRTRSRFIPKDERDDYGCDVDANNSLRSQIALFLEKHCPAFRYKGRANHVGYWETSSDNDQLIELTKPNGDAGRAAFRLIVHFPNEYGIPVHVDMFPAPYWEWETVFNGYISNVCDLIRVFGFQLGIPLQDLFQYDSLGNAICPKKHLSNTTKARCVGCPVGDSCEYKGLLNK